MRLLLIIAMIVLATEQKPCDTSNQIGTTGLCNITQCIKCDNKRAICTTTDPHEVVPRNLHPHTQYLDLTYNGPPVELDMSVFCSFIRLEYITIVGKHITSLAPNTFINQENIKTVNITGSQISELPVRLFHPHNHLQELYFPKNQFKWFPVDIFPNILNVTALEFSFNPLNSCSQNKTSIGSEFGQLTKLNKIVLRGFGIRNTSCRHLSPGYLSPLSHIQVIDLSETHIFSGGQRILTPLLSLTELHIDNLPLYRMCPVNAEGLFHNLPEHLTTLSMQSWATTSRADSSCFLDGRSLAGLKQLKKLSHLDIRYSDKIFGNSLNKSVFDGFQNLKVLYIGWCGISWIEENAFDSLNKLSMAILGGNLIGPRKFSLFSSGSKLRDLNLMSIGINSAERYDISALLRKLPRLNTLYLDNNFMKEIPVFISKDDNDAESATSIIEHVKLDRNYISSLSVAVASQMCQFMPKLLSLSMKSNKLVDTSGICASIHILSLANNFIGTNQEKNFQAISRLSMLGHLDLSNNLIDYIPAYLFDNKPHLSVLILSRNQITNLPLLPPHLTVLHLTSNLLSTFTKNDINRLKNIEGIYIEDNSISSFSSEMLESLSNEHQTLNTLAIGENPLVCSCKDDVKNWIINSTIILEPKSITCKPPEAKNDSVTVRLIDYTPNQFYCFIEMPLMIALTSLAGFLVSLAIALPCCKYRWYISHCRIAFRAIVEKLQEVRFEQQCEYDALVSYNSDSESDREWVEQKLISAVEEVNQPADDGVSKKPKLFITDRDSTPGATIYNELCDTVKNSRKIIILLTNSYLSSTSCLHQAQFLIGTNMLDNSECYQPDRILVIILEELNEEIMDPSMTSLLTSNINVINVTECQNNEKKMKRVWKKVVNFISRPKYVYRKRKAGERGDNFPDNV